MVAGALNANPGNAALRSFSANLGIGASADESIHLERMVDPANGFIDFTTWSQTLLEIEGQVCRIELGKEALGTGFIVGDSLVLTNRHVVTDVIDDPALAKSITLRFDYKRSRAGVEVHAGTTYGLEEEWLVDERPHSMMDTQAGSNGEPAADELDYALLRVAPDSSGRSIAQTPVGGKEGAATRLHLSAPVPPSGLEPDQPIVIVQHPNGQPLKLAIDTSAIISVGEQRVRYRTNTEPGSSGSPVFDGHLQLVALLHAGDPDYSDLHRPEYNQGIPIERVRSSIKDRTGLEVMT